MSNLSLISDFVVLQFFQTSFIRQTLIQAASSQQLHSERFPPYELVILYPSQSVTEVFPTIFVQAISPLTYALPSEAKNVPSWDYIQLPNSRFALFA